MNLNTLQCYYYNHKGQFPQRYVESTDNVARSSREETSDDAGRSSRRSVEAEVVEAEVVDEVVDDCETSHQEPSNAAVEEPDCLLERRFLEEFSIYQEPCISNSGTDQIADRPDRPDRCRADPFDTRTCSVQSECTEDRMFYKDEKFEEYQDFVDRNDDLDEKNDLQTSVDVERSSRRGCNTRTRQSCILPVEVEVDETRTRGQ